MQELKITNTDPSGRYHLVYLNYETGQGGMSPDPVDGHVHELFYDAAREPVEPTPAMLVDPNTGEQMEAPVLEDGTPDEQAIQEAVNMGLQFIEGTPGDPGKEVGEWIVAPGGADMHEHEIQDYRTKPTTSNETDEEILKECMSLWREALEITRESREKGRESEDFYAGKQWDDMTARLLNSLDRAALTINEIGPAIDTLIGYQMEQRTDIRYLPQEGGDQRVADMLNVVSKKILDACYFQREETKVFKDQCLLGFGAFHVYMSHDNTIQGDIKVERFPWWDIVYGPHEKEDLSDCEYEIRSRMQSIASLKQKFGKKADEIERSYKSYLGQYPDIDRKDTGVNGTNTDYRYAKKLDDVPYTVDGTFPLVDVQKKQFRLVQVTRKTYREVTVIFNQSENFFLTAYDWKDKDISLASTIPGFQVISQIKTRMRITRFCGNVILSDENPAELPIHDFYTVPAYGYRQNGYFWGKVEAAKDPQRELNKRRSQVMDTINRLGASVYYIEPETFKDNNEKERFKKNRSKPGSIFDVNDLNRTPKLEEGAQFPAAMVQLMQLDQENLQRLMNVVVQPGGANESGLLFLEKKKGRLTANQFLFDNLSFAKQKLGKIIAALIQKYYPAERLERLLNAQYSKSKFKIGGEDYGKYSKEEILEMLRCADLMEYDVIVAESSFAPSTRLGIAMALFELIQKGAAVPPELPLQFIDMPADIRMQVSESMQQQSQATAEAATNTSNTEIKKTLIAKGQYTVNPEEAANLGLVPADPNIPLANDGKIPNNGENGTQATEYADNLASSLAG